MQMILNRERNVRKKTEAGDITVPDLKLYYRRIVTETE